MSKVEFEIYVCRYACEVVCLLVGEFSECICVYVCVCKCVPACMYVLHI